MDLLTQVAVEPVAIGAQWQASFLAAVFQLSNFLSQTQQETLVLWSVMVALAIRAVPIIQAGGLVDKTQALETLLPQQAAAEELAIMPQQHYS